MKHVKISNGKIITLLDGDDFYAKNKILTISKQKGINENFYLRKSLNNNNNRKI